ncbi:MAG TPA: hypothetical protein VKI41_17650 [Vicinamibacteria bacterium]|nr:hypothetical protein [Vicinamibacteria bacterium]
MAETEAPFADVRILSDGFSIPVLKWRELLFVGAVRGEGGTFMRDPARPLPPFRLPDLFPEGVRLRVQRQGGRVVIRPLRV